MSSWWQKEPARIVGQVHALLALAAALGFVLDDKTTSAIVAAATAIAAVLASEVVRSKVTSPATAKAHLVESGLLSAKLSTISTTPFAGGGVAGYGKGFPVNEVGTYGDPGPWTNVDPTIEYNVRLVSERGPELTRLPPGDVVTAVKTAPGIHAHDRYKTGLKPHGKPADQLLHLDWLEGVTYEPVVDRLSSITIGLDKNDSLGDCAEAAADNHRRITTLFETGKEVDAAIGDVLDLYARSTSPPFNPKTGANDNGTDMVSLFKAMKTGGLAGEKIVAYAKLKDTRDESIYAAIDIFGAVIFAVDLQTAQQTQTDSGYWDYKKSSDWGGHAIVAARYDSNTADIYVGSWGQQVRTTAAFRTHQLSEVWVPIYASLLASDKFVTNVDRATLAADFTSLTGGTLPLIVPPPVTPPPVTGDALFQSALDAVKGLDAKLVKNAAAKKMTVPAYVAWLASGALNLR